MSGHVKSQLSAYMAGGLMEAQKRQVDSHLAECEKCRQYLSKLRAKEARSKREALKSAMPNTPNLFVSRISRQQATLATPPSPVRKWVLVPLLLTAVIWAGFKWGWFEVFTSWRQKTSDTAALASAPSMDASPALPSVSSMTETGTMIPPPATDEKDNADETAPAAASSSVSSVSSAPEVVRQRQWKGSFSLIKDYREIVLKNRDAWRDTWHEMNGPDSKTPRVDFEQQMVIGIFLGEKPVAGYTVSLLPAKEENGQIVIRYTITEPPADQPAATVITHPYHLMTIPKTDKKIVFIKGAAL